MEITNSWDNLEAGFYYMSVTKGGGSKEVWLFWLMGY